MAEEKSSAVDPFAAWRDWLNQAERQMNSFFNNMMGSEQYNRALGEFNKASLNIQKSMNDSVQRYLASFNLPNREDFAEIGRRITALEDRVAVIEAKNSDPEKASSAGLSANTSMPRPPRTRKPSTEKPKG